MTLVEGAWGLAEGVWGLAEGRRGPLGISDNLGAVLVNLTTVECEAVAGEAVTMTTPPLLPPAVPLRFDPAATVAQ